ncbi:valine--tRNA ligase [Chondromyces apiculatus]|uniref:Valine--tRNA ligase n=1 Tax=Chondromyces apiculatus DSM 436 TaxID=1192034 RepID=A0A017TAF9_9BACT|nr:valine--tRNA ligase [Chondromyces apiculatus]EYF05571.1 Valyl-tRNA synthetase [Chondromyces apiculatus DSM 436]
MSTDLAKAYEPKDVETRWYTYWTENNVFAASDAPDDTRPTYVLPMPPPNVTGSLHMGHALFCTIEDILSRYHRMTGHNTLWQPGTDHAGIATQLVVERLLQREGTSRHDLGREKFIERVWQWRVQAGDRILEQQRVLGVSADWSRSKFTMDPDLSRAVSEAFVRLHREGLIYRDTRLIYWDCEARTVLSNLEVENEPANGELFEFAYPLEDGTGEIVVATTRPETMLGDTAVAIHPDDERYKALHGKRVRHPFVDRLIPIITDAELVDPKFGTGAVKVTPAHDFNDFATGKRHKLEEISILNPDGTINAIGGDFAGMDRFAARKAVKKALDEKGLARGTKPHQLVLPRSERNNSIVEPMISTQWFVRTAPLAEPALAAVREGKTRIIPEEWSKTYEHWMSNILDWCISRQLWWGHRIPAFHCSGCAHITVTTDESPKACETCGSTDIHQDEDVLDTWFSSALWPFSTLGWPNDTLALKRFYPASDLETGYDILFFWVARMMMMGIHFMGEPPFKRILLHGLVVDETGEKMSKVKGNVIDPLDLIHGATFEQVVEKALPGAPLQEALKKFKKAYPSTAQMGEGFAAYGADALRFTLATYSPQAKRIPLSPKKIEGNRNFCNKIWNATRFALTYLEGARVGATAPPATLLANRWILSRLSAVAAASRTGIDDFRLDDASLGLYHFFWGELCDWFLELTKPVFADRTSAAAIETRDVLAYTLEAALRLLHPFVPFITEELWHRLPRPESPPLSLGLAHFPDDTVAPRDAAAERDMAVVQAIIGAARSVRSEHEVHPGAEVPLTLRTDDAELRALLTSQSVAIRTLVKSAGDPTIGPREAERPRGAVMSVAAGVEVLVALVGLVEGHKEAARIEREIKKAEKDIAALEKKLALPSFADKAPPEVVAESHAQLTALRDKRAGLEHARKIAAELD